MVNQAKLRSYSSAKRYKYGFGVPRNYEDDICIDSQNAKTKWQDMVRMELESVHSFNVFIDKGLTVPAGYCSHLVFDVKHDGRHKACLVANGHLTDAPPPLGHYVTTSHYVSANLMHDLVTGKLVTGFIHFSNQTPINMYTKKQTTVETATYGSEFVAACTCTEKIIELQTLL
jgi:hypothetical protein